MKGRICITLMILLCSILVSCTQPSSPEGPIKPGDKIGDFLITTGIEEEFTPTWDINCIKQGDTEDYNCETDLNTKVNISWGVFWDPSKGKDLDTIWSESTYEMEIEGRPVDLQAFGSIDVEDPHIGKMRLWNIVIVASKPGAISVHDKGNVGGDPFESTMQFTFVSP